MITASRKQIAGEVPKGGSILSAQHAGRASDRESCKPLIRCNCQQQQLMARVLGKQMAKPLSLHSKNQNPCTHSQQSKLGSGIQDFHSHDPGQTAAPEAVKAPGLSGIGTPQIDHRLMSGVAGKTDADHYSFGPGPGAE